MAEGGGKGYGLAPPRAQSAYLTEGGRHLYGRRLVRVSDMGTADKQQPRLTSTRLLPPPERRQLQGRVLAQWFARERWSVVDVWMAVHAYLRGLRELRDVARLNVRLTCA